MNFQLYKQTVKNHVLDFYPSKEWDSEEWNRSYIDFKEGVSKWPDEYKAQFSEKEIIVKWAKDYYSPATKDTHDYWVKNLQKP